MVSKQTRIWMVNDREVQFDIVKFNHLFKVKAQESGIGITKYEEVVADALSVDSSTIHNWRFNLNGPSDTEKVYSLEKFWNVEENTLLKEVIMSKTEVTALTDRELAALKNVYNSVKTFMDFYYNTDCFKKDKCDKESANRMFYRVKENVEAEYVDLKKKLYDALYEFVENDLQELLDDAELQDVESEPYPDEDEEGIKNQVYSGYMDAFKNIIDPYLLA